MGLDDDESVLDLADQTNRPSDTALQQQRIQAWHPILDPEWMIYTFMILALVLIPVGYNLEKMSNDVYENTTVYDSIDPNDQLCGIGMNYNANENCTITFVAPRDLTPPVLLCPLTFWLQILVVRCSCIL